MNHKMFKQNLGAHVQLQPVARRFDGFGRRLPEINDDWLIREINEDSIDIANTATGHVVTLGNDAIHHFMSNPNRSRGQTRYGFLVLHAQVSLRGCNADITPNRRPGIPANL